MLLRWLKAIHLRWPPEKANPVSFHTRFSSSSMAIRLPSLAFARLPARARALAQSRFVDWAGFAVKRTKNAAKRTANTLEIHDTRSPAINFLSCEMVELRPCRPRADGTYMDTDNSIVWPLAGVFRKRRSSGSFTPGPGWALAHSFWHSISRISGFSPRYSTSSSGWRAGLR